MTESCSNCRFWKKKTSLNGFCCAHPPVRVDAGLSSFPTSGADTWCGEWQRIPMMTPAEVEDELAAQRQAREKKTVDKTRPTS
jgi:hypothetical protein